MRLGDLLIESGLVTQEQITSALETQSRLGGRIGDNLVRNGAITQSALDAFLHRIPAEPANLAATHIDSSELLSLLLRIIYVDHLETVRQFVEAIKLPYSLVHDLVQMAVERKRLYTLGTRESPNPLDMRYVFTEEGRRWVIDALNQSRYTGPAPVTLEEFVRQVLLQKTTNELITFYRILEASKHLTFETHLIEQAGPALNSGRAMLLYGPPGNGKTSVALSFAGVFTDPIYIPYAILVEGQIIRVYDSSLHKPVQPKRVTEEAAFSLIRGEEHDARWVACERPFVVVGGELTLEMLDLRYDPAANYYEAPMHMKALGGCFVIDDFGRQLVSPTNLLNRWIVPLESRIDYLKLHTGKTFSVPFEAMVIFSTNLEPEDLMDPAFLRRLPYKIEVAGPPLPLYKQIFTRECEKQGLQISDEAFDIIVHKLTREKGLLLAAYQPRFIIDQVVATCKFMGQPPHFEPRFIDYALNNLRVHRQPPATANPS
jgi:hypothetical protein